MSASSSQTRSRSVWPIFIVGLILMALFYLGSQYLLSSNPTPDEEAARAELRAKNLEELQKDNEQKLNHYSWADKAKGTVRIPVDKAMELVIPTLRQTRPHPAYPIESATPAPAASAKPQASPAPSAAASPSPAHS